MPKTKLKMTPQIDDEKTTSGPSEWRSRCLDMSRCQGHWGHWGGRLRWKFIRLKAPEIMDVLAIESDELVEVDPLYRKKIPVFIEIYTKVWEFTLQHNWL